MATLADKVRAGSAEPIIELLLRHGEMSTGAMAAALGMAPMVLRPILVRMARSDSNPIIEHDQGWYSLDLGPEAA